MLVNSRSLDRTRFLDSDAGVLARNDRERESRRTPAGWLDWNLGLDYALVEHRVGCLGEADWRPTDYEARVKV